MRITKEGLDPAKETYETTCGRCGTEFEFVGSEATHAEVRMKPGDDPLLTMAGGYFWDVRCPLCGIELRVNQRHTQRNRTMKKLEEL